MNIGIIYENYKQFEKAIEYYKKGFEFDLQPDTYIRAISNLASCYNLMEDYENSELNYLYAISESEKYFGKNNFLTSNMYINYGIFCDNLGKPDEALKYLQDSYSINTKIKGLSESFLANNLTQLGIHYSRRKNYPVALEYFQLALISVIETFHEGDIYKNPGYQELYVDLSLFNTLYSKIPNFI
ncbi:MAG: tetratricopeptide repeat protein [Bacteroidales bacterium]